MIDKKERKKKERERKKGRFLFVLNQLNALECVEFSMIYVCY